MVKFDKLTQFELKSGKMALASEDIWKNVDMNSSNNIDILVDCVANDSDVLSSSALRLARSLKDDTDSLVPDIADIMIDSSTLDIGIDMEFDHFLDDILRLEDEPLRQDCMWSSQEDGEDSSNLGEQMVRQQREAKPRLDTLPTANINMTDLACKGLSCFDTPLPSETSDLDETSSDLEAEVDVGVETSAKTKLDITYSDHCYISTSRNDRLTETLTPTDSSEEDEAKTPTQTKHIKSFQSSNTFRIPSFPTHRLKQDSSSRVRKPSQAKFKFHMKFKPNENSLSARSLLRQNSVLQRKKTIVRSSLIPYSSKSIQVSQTRVLTGDDDVTILGKKPNVRDLHNSLERQRRIDLRNAFDTLRNTVPELRVSDKASKLLILNKSRDYCWKLASRESSLQRELKLLRSRQQTLIKKLKMVNSANRA